MSGRDPPGSRDAGGPVRSDPAAEGTHGAAGANIVSLDKRRFVDDLYRSHWNELCGWLWRRYGPGPPEPEDIAQSAFRKISEMEDVSVIRDPKAFLFTVAARTAISGFRWRTRTREFIDREMLENGMEVEEITPERVYMEKERLQIVAEGLSELSEMQRELVIRNRVLGQTYARIAEETGWSLASISRHLQAALIAVARRLSEGDDANGGTDR